MKQALVKLKTKIKALEDKMQEFDGKKPRKKRGKKKKIYTLENLPSTRGFGGKRILKDGTFGDFAVYFGKVYDVVEQSRADKIKYLSALRVNMILNFGVYHETFDETIKTVMVDMVPLRTKRRKKDAVLPNEPHSS